jgi:hypothetical protein
MAPSATTPTSSSATSTATARPTSPARPTGAFVSPRDRLSSTSLAQAVPGAPRSLPSTTKLPPCQGKVDPIEHMFLGFEWFYVNSPCLNESGCAGAALSEPVGDETQLDEANQSRPPGRPSMNTSAPTCGGMADGAKQSGHAQPRRRRRGVGRIRRWRDGSGNGVETYQEDGRANMLYDDRPQCRKCFGYRENIEVADTVLKNEAIEARSVPAEAALATYAGLKHAPALRLT